MSNKKKEQEFLVELKNSIEDTEFWDKIPDCPRSPYTKFLPKKSFDSYWSTFTNVFALETKVHCLKGEWLTTPWNLKKVTDYQVEQLLKFYNSKPDNEAFIIIQTTRFLATAISIMDFMRLKNGGVKSLKINDSHLASMNDYLSFSWHPRPKKWDLNLIKNYKELLEKQWKE